MTLRISELAQADTSPTIYEDAIPEMPHLSPRRMVTINDVARLAGVGRSSVSAVLSGKQGGAGTRVAEETRQRILRAGEQLGYKPSSSARTMRSGRFNCAGLLLSTEPGRSLVPYQLLDGIHDELAGEGMHLTVAKLSDEKLTSAGFVPKILRELMIDGLLIDYTNNIPEALVNLLTDHALPAIWINSKQRFDCVRPDDFGAAVTATEHLLKLGHRRIAYAHLYRLPDEAHEHYSVFDRHEGYLSAMKDAGATPESILVKDVPREAHARLLAEVLRREDRPTAFVTYGDEAEAILWAATCVELQVPRDLSLVSLSHSGGRWSGLCFATVMSPEEDMGRCAAAMLQQKILAPQQRLRSQVIPFTFAEGDSTAAWPVREN